MSRTLEWGIYAGDQSPFNSDLQPVYAAHKHGNALFIIKGPFENWFTCAVTGHLSTGGKTLEEAMASGEEWAMKCAGERGDRVVSFAHMKENLKSMES